MADNYEIEIEPGEEMQLDDTGAQNVNRKGRGFGNNAGEAQLGRNGSGRLGSAGNPAHATAVRCNSSNLSLNLHTRDFSCYSPSRSQRLRTPFPRLHILHTLPPFYCSLNED